MLSCFALAVLVGLQVPNPQVEFESHGLAVGSMLEKLSAQTKVQLKAAGTVSQEIVFVRVKGVPLSELKERLGKALYASWVQKPDGEYLEQSAAQKQEIWQEHLTLRAKMVEEALQVSKKLVEQPFDPKALARGLAELKPRSEFSDDRQAALQHSQREKALFDSGALSRFLHRLVLACNPKDLAAVGPYERRIFTFKPTRMQYKIADAGFRAAQSAFAKEQQAWIEAAAATSFPEDRNGRMVSDPRSQIDLSPKFGDDVLLEVRRGDMAGLFSVNLIAERPRFGLGTVAQAHFADPARKFLNSFGDAKPSEKDPKVTLSPDSEEFQNRMMEAFEGRVVVPPSSRMLELFLNVDKNEPLGWTVSDCLRDYGKLKNKNIVALLSDMTVTVAAFVSKGQPLKVEQSIRALVDAGTSRIEEAGNWVLFTPADRWEAAQYFTLRDPLAELIRSVHAKAALDIRDYARYAFQSGRTSRLGFGEVWLGMYDRGYLGATDHTDWDGLRLYGSFTSAAQKELEAGKRFPLSGLNQQQRRIVEKVVFGDEIRSEERLDSGQSELHHAPVEPTEAFPNGLPAALTVVGRSKSNPVIVAYGQTPNGDVRPLRNVNVWTLATIETDVVGNAQRMADYGVPNLVGYSLGTDKMISIRIELAPGLWKETSIMVPEYDRKAKPVKWDQLPEQYRKEIAAAIEQKKSQKGGGAPPPPR